MDGRASPQLADDLGEDRHASESEWEGAAEDQGADADDRDAGSEASDRSGPWAEWVEVLDDDTGLPYYFNTVTAESLWEKPAAMIEQEELEALETAGDADALEAVQEAERPPNRFTWSDLEDLAPPPAHRAVPKVYGSVFASKGATIPRFVVLGVPPSSLQPAVPLRPLPQRSGSLQKRGGKGVFGRRWQRRWFVLHGRLLRYYKKPQARVQRAGAALDAASREHMRVYASRGVRREGASGAAVAATPGGRGGGPQGRGPGVEAGAFEASAGAAGAAAALRAAERSSAGGSAASQQGSHTQRAAMAASLEEAETADGPLGTLTLYGGWIRELEEAEAGGREFCFLLLPGEGSKVYELAASSADDLRAWLTALRGAGCRVARAGGCR